MSSEVLERALAGLREAGAAGDAAACNKAIMKRHAAEFEMLDKEQQDAYEFRGRVSQADLRGAAVTREQRCLPSTRPEVLSSSTESKIARSTSHVAHGSQHHHGVHAQGLVPGWL